ncbi:MAG: NAD-dependent epimerase/dehydratase family protein [Acidobacteria bacterium]|nr:NAD-dependent epimerase/dehydratase family protein [Acidobacteriota bacterium]
MTGSRGSSDIREWAGFGPGRTMLVTGAAGFIGSRLTSLALARGYRIKTLTRSDWSAGPPVPVGDRHFGALPTQIPVESLQGVNVVVHCAVSRETGEQSSYAVNVEGTLRLARLARQAGVETFLFVSSQSARPDALSTYGRTKHAAEQILRGLDGLNVIILRPGLVTGPGSRGLFGRLRRMVDSLPVIPLLGGGRAIVQPIHVDDLCEAVFRCDRGASGLHGSILKLGHPQGLTLAAFLQAMARARLGRGKIMLPVPLWPVETAITLAEAAGIPLPINSNNIKGLRLTEKMDTEADWDRLNLKPRPLEEMFADAPAPADRPASLRERAVRVLLIGAGRIGLVHAIVLSRLPGTVLCGVADPSAAARGLLRGMGLSAAMFDSPEQALAQTAPDAAVIATPAATHLPLARACLGRGLAAVMVEKPLALGSEQLADYEQLSREFPVQAVHVGYVMPRNPQIETCLERLRAGEFGKVKAFVGVTLLSFIQERETPRWEVKKNISGGGVLINAGGHVLSMIRAAFGDPTKIEAESRRLYSAEVEDSMVLTFSYPAFKGRQYCSWSIQGYPRQENMLTVWTERGRLTLTGSVGVFVTGEGEVDITHQLDSDVGFNIAPDYAGAGFTRELADLREASRSGRSTPLNLTGAIGLERLLFRAYQACRAVENFSQEPSDGKPAIASSPNLAGELSAANGTTRPRCVLDLRDLAPDLAAAYLRNRDTGSKWDEYQVLPTQIRRLPRGMNDAPRLRVTVPDFLHQSRLLAAGRYGEVVRQMRLGGIAGAARIALPLLASERAATFWVAAMGLLGAALDAVPVKFSGTLLIHVYLADLALSLRRLDMLGKMVAACRRRRPRARVGFHTNMAAEASNALWLLDTPVDEVSVLTSPRAQGLSSILADMRGAGKRRAIGLTAEVGLAPPVVHRAARLAPHRWAWGAEAVLLGIWADPLLAEQSRKEAARQWQRVFPGLSLPEGAL